VTVNTYGLREVADLTFYDLTTNRPFLYLPYALTSSNEHTSQVTYARGGKGNPKRMIFDGNRESTLKISTQLFDFRIISLLAGAEVTSGSTNIFKREELVVTENAGNMEVVLSMPPANGSIAIYLIDEDAFQGEECAISVNGSAVTITSPITAGEKVIAYYQHLSGSAAEKISFKTDKFPKACKVIGDTLLKNEATNENEPFQMIVYKAKPQANFTLNMTSEGEPTKLDMTFELMADSSNNFIDYIKY